VADDAGRAYFSSLLKSGVSLQTARAIMASSDEFFNRTGGTNQGFVGAVFADRLGRQPDADGAAYFAGELDNAALGTVQQRRELVHLQVANSSEGATREASVLFNTYLARASDPAGLAYFSGLLYNQVSEQEVIARMVGSQEFFEQSATS